MHPTNLFEMDNFGLRESRDVKFDRYFKKTGILISDEPMSETPQEVDEFIQEHYPYLQKTPRKYVRKLERLYEKYPNVPSIQNYLYLVYSLTKQESKANIVLKKTIREHPDYIFGFCSKILDAKSWKEAEEYTYAMGKDMDIRSLKKKDEIIHISEFKTYQITAGLLHCIKGEEKKAGERLESLMEIGCSRKEIETAAKKIATGHILGISRRIEKSKDMRLEPESFDKVGLEQTEEPPMLNHEELRVFYEKGTKELTEEERNKLIALPRATLIQDLETILEDSIRRFDFFKKENDDSGYEDFMIHALWFLAALNSKESFPKVLNLFRMGDDFRMFWFGDWFENYFDPALEILGGEQLELLADFFKEENIGTWLKNTPLRIFRQVGLKYPDRREEVLDFFEKTANYFFENEDNENLIDTSFMTTLAYEILILRGKKLIPILKKIDEKNWLDEMHAGSLEKILREIESPIDSYRIEPSPENIHEFYTEAYRARKAKHPMSDNFENLLAEREDNMGLGEKLIERFRQNSFLSLLGGRKVETDDLLKNYVGTDDFENDAERFLNVQKPLGSADNFFDSDRPTTVKRIGKKIGRNDPCPCGSGKKYKKCCL